MNPEQTLGERLRQAREAKGLSLEAVGRETRLALSVLRALEEDRRGELPGDLYVANALRMLADTLELDRDELMALFRGGQPAAATPVTAPGKVWREEVPETRVVGGWRPGRGLWLGLGLLVVAGAILGAVLWAVRAQTPPSAPAVQAERPGVDASLGPIEPPPPEEDSLTQAAQAAQPVDSLALAAWAAGPLALAGALEGTEPREPGGDAAQEAAALRIELDAAAPIQLQLNVDDRRRLVRALAAGEVWRVEADHFVVLNVANAEGLALRLNGQDYPLPALPAGVPLALRLDAPVTAEPAGDG